MFLLTAALTLSISSSPSRPTMNEVRLPDFSAVRTPATTTFGMPCASDDGVLRPGESGYELCIANKMAFEEQNSLKFRALGETVFQHRAEMQTGGTVIRQEIEGVPF